MRVEGLGVRKERTKTNKKEQTTRAGKGASARQDAATCEDAGGWKEKGQVKKSTCK